MARYVRLYLALMALNIRASWQFPGQMLIRVFLTLILESLQLVVLWVVLDHFGSVGGWTFWEIAVLLALKEIAFVIYHQLFWTGGLDTAVIHGDLDKFLIRPLDPLVHFLADHEQWPGRVAQAAFSIALLVVASFSIPIEWTLLKFIGLGIGFGGGVLIYTGIQLLGSSIAFWTKREDTLTVLIPWMTDTYTRYPLHIYGGVVHAALTFVIPFAFINFIPAAFVLDRGGNLFFSPLIVFSAPVIGVLVMLAGAQVWRQGLRIYESAGN